MNSELRPDIDGTQVVRYQTTARTNWHYSAARALTEGTFVI